VKAASRTVQRVGVIDDDEDARIGYTWAVEDADLEPADERGPLGSLNAYARSVVGRLDAVLCDHHLKVGNYADFEGVELAAALYEHNIPAVLCTSWETAELDYIRGFRSKVPVLIRPDELEPDVLTEALDITIRELSGEFSQQRRPWRTLVDVVELDPEEFYFYVKLPGWTSDEVIKLRQSDLPRSVWAGLRKSRFLHAEVNIGAESSSELYFINWEPS
jgi:hypothetical protein